jgi:hypothetical protein
MQWCSMKAASVSLPQCMSSAPGSSFFALSIDASTTCSAAKVQGGCSAWATAREQRPCGHRRAHTHAYTWAPAPAATAACASIHAHLQHDVQCDHMLLDRLEFVARPLLVLRASENLHLLLDLVDDAHVGLFKRRVGRALRQAFRIWCALREERRVARLLHACAAPSQRWLQGQTGGADQWPVEARGGAPAQATFDARWCCCRYRAPRPCAS